MKDNSNITQEFLETVERYYNGTMVSDERIEFETKLKQDATFKSQVDDIKALLFGVETQSLKEKMDEFHKDLPIKLIPEKKTFRLRQYSFMKIAAAAVIFIAVGSFWFLNGSSNERLFDSHFSPDPGLPTTMSTSDNFKFYDAMVNYKQGDYEKAISKWEALHKNAPENDTINYFIGVANLAKNNTDQAIFFLSETASIQKSVFYKDANYYLGLAYLKKNDTQNAKKFLKMSATEESKMLLEKLD